MEQHDHNKHIGMLIARFREARGMTQRALAKALGTSQSAVARIEKGDQNLTIDMLGKVSEALNHQLVALSDGSVSFKIEGGRPLRGSIACNTAKNSAMAILAASLLNKGTTTLKNMPRIEEVSRILEVLESIGMSVKRADTDIILTPPKRFSLGKINREAAMKTRSVIMFAGALAHEFNDFTLPEAGGCKLGSRTIRPHLYALEAFGITASNADDAIRFRRKNLHAAEFVLYEMSDTATNNALLAAARIPGTTVIKCASANYQVQDLCYFLETLGVRLEGIGTSTLTVYGKEHIDMDATGYPSEDPTEGMFFIAAATTTGSKLTIKRAPIDFLELELLKLEKMGLRSTKGARYKAQNGKTNLADLTIFPSKLKALDEHIHPTPGIGINIDNLPFFAVIATQAEGTSLIHDWVYEKRAIYYTELDKLGAHTILADPHRIFVTGPTALKPAELVCPPALRPATILLIAMLAAKGTSILRNVYSINRGYEDLVARLSKIGAKIELLHDIR